jgi:hypothetical protein
MGLTQHQIDSVWREKVEAEVRSLYFGELASRYTARKQVMAGISFFLSSGAAATVIAKAPTWVPATLAIISAIAAAYSFAIDIEKRISSLAELHEKWNLIALDLDILWNHWYDADAEETMRTLSKRASDASALGVKMPYEEPLIDKWTDRAAENLYIRELPVQVDAAFPAELLSFDNRLSALRAGLLDIDQFLSAFSAEV